MSEPYIEDWHTVTVTVIPADADGPEEFDYDVEHPPSCAIDPGEVHYLAYRCGFQGQIDFAGVDVLEIGGSGVYRARFVYWPEYYSTPDGGGDPEVEIIVERVAEVAA